MLGFRREEVLSDSPNSLEKLQNDDIICDTGVFNHAGAFVSASVIARPVPALRCRTTPRAASLSIIYSDFYVSHVYREALMLRCRGAAGPPSGRGRRVLFFPGVS